jgi:hypothetical protein
MLQKNSRTAGGEALRETRKSRASLYHLVGSGEQRRRYGG